MIISSW